MTAMIAVLFSAIALVSIAVGQAQAIQIPYEDIGTTSIKTPVFNTYTNVPNGVGNEADFVRIRPSTGDVADNGAGGVRNALYVNGQTADCKVGEKFDIRTYVHNGADDEFNDNGNGPTVAHGTEARMVAPFGTLGKTLTFTSTIRATDVSPVTDTARLYCNSDKDVMLKLVPSTVKVYSSQYGFVSAPDSAVNGVLPIGSRVAGSGDVWGCWADRVMVAYIIEVVETEKPATPVYTCDLLSATLISNKKYKFTANATAKNGATITGYEFNFGDGSAKVKTDKNVVEYTYPKDGTFKSSVMVKFMVNGQAKEVSGPSCEVSITTTTPPPTTPPTTTPPTTLPSTGAGSTVAIVLATVSALGAYAHRAFTLKRQ